MKYNSNIIQIDKMLYDQMLYHNISPFCETLSFDLPYEFFSLFAEVLHSYMRPYFFNLHTNFFVFYTNFSLHFVHVLHCLFHTNFLPLFLKQIDSDTLYIALHLSLLEKLPRLFCFYNLTKHSSYTLLHAVPLRQ